MSMPRALVTTTDPALRRAAASMFTASGFEVLTADGGVDCVEQARARAPDLLVLLPPLLWGSVAGVLAVLHDDPGTRHVPVLILGQPVREGALPRLVVAGTAEGTDALPPLLERLRMRAPALANAVLGPPAP